MPFIIKNGKYYGSSADGSVDITEEEYNNLLASGQVNPSITYYITDGELEGEDSFSGIIEVTQQEYDELSDEEKNNGAIYAITDSEDLVAKNMAYDGSVTGLGNNVQDAIDNVNNKVDEQNKNFEVSQKTYLSLGDTANMVINRCGKILSCQFTGYLSLTSGWHTFEDFLPETIKAVYRQNFNFTTDTGKIVYGFLEGRNLEIYTRSSMSEEGIYAGFLAMIE